MFSGSSQRFHAFTPPQFDSQDPDEVVQPELRIGQARYLNRETYVPRDQDVSHYG